MKKSLSIVLVLLLLLTACQVMPDNDQSLASTPSSAGSITPPPSSSVVPPSSSTAPTVPTTQPTVPPTTQPTVPSYDIYDGDTWLSGFKLSWKVYDPYYQKYKYILISDDTRYYSRDDTHIYFVKHAEPTKIYVVAIGDFSNPRLFYESSDGDITDIECMFYSQGEIRNYLQFVVDEKRFVMLNITTNELAVILEAYEIKSAFTYDPDGEWITFEGTLTEGGKGGLFDYNRFTGELIEDTDCDCEECV